MENYKIIDTKIAVSLLKLSEGDLEKLLKFIDEFCEMFFKEGCNNSWSKFVNCVSSELKIPNSKGNVVHRVSKKNEYKEIVLKYSSLLRHLMLDEILNDLFRIMSEENKKEHFITFIKSLVWFYDDRSLMLDNLLKMKDLKINRFGYDTSIMLDGEYTISVGNSLYGGNQYSVRGICSDGEKKWYPEIENGKYSFDLVGASYVIKYSKNTITSNGVFMSCKNLIFDSNTLPTYQELYDSTCLPNVDYDVVSRKTDVFASIYQLEQLKDNAEKLYKELENSLNMFYTEFFSKDELLALKGRMKKVEELINEIDDMIENAIVKYDEKGIMSAFELKKSLQRKDNVNNKG